jgi:hypothetical protein
VDGGHPARVATNAVTAAAYGSRMAGVQDAARIAVGLPEVAEGHRGLFTIEHFKGYPATLIELAVVGKAALREAIVDGWLAAAPASLAKEFLEHRSGK